MPQELLACRYFQSREIDRCIRQPRDLLSICGIWLEHPEQYQQLKARMQLHRFDADWVAIRQLLFDGPQALV